VIATGFERQSSLGARPPVPKASVTADRRASVPASRPSMSQQNQPPMRQPVPPQQPIEQRQPAPPPAPRSDPQPRNDPPPARNDPPQYNSGNAYSSDDLDIPTFLRKR